MVWHLRRSGGRWQGAQKRHRTMHLRLTLRRCRWFPRQGSFCWWPGSRPRPGGPVACLGACIFPGMCPIPSRWWCGAGTSGPVASGASLRVANGRVRAAANTRVTRTPPAPDGGRLPARFVRRPRLTFSVEFREGPHGARGFPGTRCRGRGEYVHRPCGHGATPPSLVDDKQVSDYVERILCGCWFR